MDLDLSGKDKDRAGFVLPVFYSRPGEELTVPKRFQGVVRSVTKAVNCEECSHCHFGRAPEKDVRVGVSLVGDAA